MNRVEHADMLQAIPRLVSEGVVCDACVTDPPYHLLPTVNRFKATKIGGSTDVERRAASKQDGLGRLAGGFMGQQWDGGDIAFRPETWVGTAAVAALKTGRNAILIEREANWHADIIERVAFYEGEGRHSLAAKARRSPQKPLGGLFAQ